MILSKVRDFIGDSPIVAHAYENERDFLDYEFARAKVIAWGDSAYDEERYICTILPCINVRGCLARV